MVVEKRISPMDKGLWMPLLRTHAKEGGRPQLASCKRTVDASKHRTLHSGKGSPFRMNVLANDRRLESADTLGRQMNVQTLVLKAVPRDDELHLNTFLFAMPQRFAPMHQGPSV